MLSDSMNGLLELPGVSHVIRGSGDSTSETISISFRDEAIDMLAERFQCAPDAHVIMGELVDGLRNVFGHDAVTVKTIG